MSSEPVRSAGASGAARVIGRYSLHEEIAAGGMATVHFGRLLGPVGFARTVAIKRLHPQFAKDPEFVSMFLDEARLAARIHHPNVVPTLDVVATQGELFLVMEYVHGESLSRLLRACATARTPPPLPVLSAVMVGALHGLHAAHEARDEHGVSLGLVHRDVSPQNVLVGADGVPRVLDFGVAKASTRAQTTQDGQLKGKLRYMSAEQARSEPVDRRTDVYATGAVFYEALTGERLISGEESAAVITQILMGEFTPPHVVNPEVPRAVSELVMHAVARDPAKRFATARAFALAVEDAIPPATPTRVATWVEETMRDALARRAAKVAEIESATTHAHPLVSGLPPMSENGSDGRLSVATLADVPSGVSAREPGAESTQSTALASNVSTGRSTAGRARSSWGLIAISVAAVAFGIFALLFRLHEVSGTGVVTGAAAADVRAEPQVEPRSSPTAASEAAPDAAPVATATTPSTATTSTTAASATSATSATSGLNGPGAAATRAPRPLSRPARPAGTADPDDVYRTR